jgi:glycosyltransferase involved in cell wall biosynthesis
MHDTELVAAGKGSACFDTAVELAPLLILDALSRRSAEQIAAHMAGSDQTERFRALCGRFFDTNMALLQAARLIGPPDLIASIGLEALPGGIIAGRRVGCPVIYDAHEFWPFSTLGMTSWESEVWSAFEKRYAAMADRRVAASPQLARAMAQHCGQVFESIPSAVPLAHANFDVSRPHTRLHKDKVVFLFQGNFAAESGLEELVSAWPDTDPACVLYLRGPDQPCKRAIIALADTTGLLNKRIFFPRAVDERNSLLASLQADVGLVPYQPRSPGAHFCCPISLSQYMAAGLPIISNTFDFVSEAIDCGKCGKTVDFNNRPALVALVNAFAADRSLRQSFGRDARAYFESSFNWEKQSAGLRSWAQSLTAVASQAQGNLDFGWIENQTTMHQRSPRHRAAADAASRGGRSYDDLRNEFDSQLTELRLRLEDRERVLGELKTVGGIGRYGYRFVRRKVLRLLTPS